MADKWIMVSSVILSAAVLAAGSAAANAQGSGSQRDYQVGAFDSVAP